MKTAITALAFVFAAAVAQAQGGTAPAAPAQPAAAPATAPAPAPAPEAPVKAKKGHKKGHGKKAEGEKM